MRAKTQSTGCTEGAREGGGGTRGRWRKRKCGAGPAPQAVAGAVVLARDCFSLVLLQNGCCLNVCRLRETLVRRVPAANHLMSHIGT
ncbi:unnamed protein product [Rangifer tarandus platyrhynchus]|uniref:Uncharacterized protein n=2 Tax=Rangifer tarandus platyrhynchus TaxID=3082113 RepID=A0ACB0E0W6_RANTA|nr:unnamed protein product [Rangifer tarandus platyrhynchus]CAI9694054.1 unnamed protein product [Rangifer tarandus platyrhynchus]